jgi:hypothetical protein
MSWSKLQKDPRSESPGLFNKATTSGPCSCLPRTNLAKKCSRTHVINCYNWFYHHALATSHVFCHLPYLSEVSLRTVKFLQPAPVISCAHRFTSDTVQASQSAFDPCKNSYYPSLSAQEEAFAAFVLPNVGYRYLPSGIFELANVTYGAA